MALPQPTPPLTRSGYTGGPHQNVTPTREDGKAVSDANPWITRPTAADAAQAAVRADTNTQILVELRVISQLIAIGLSVNDDIEALRTDEFARLGL